MFKKLQKCIARLVKVSENFSKFDWVEGNVLFYKSARLEEIKDEDVVRHLMRLKECPWSFHNLSGPPPEIDDVPSNSKLKCDFGCLKLDFSRNGIYFLKFFLCIFFLFNSKTLTCSNNF